MMIYDTLKGIFNNCQHLESINVWCGGEFLIEKEALESVVKYSQSVYEIILYEYLIVRSELLLEELESFLISWMNRIPQKPLSLVIINNYPDDFDEPFISLDTNEKNMEIIEKYIKLEVIKRFKVTDLGDEILN